jgi:hypothetical protein
MYNSSFDYERFSDDEEDEHKERDHHGDKPLGIYKK